jgi:hypothetical protein
MTSQWLVFRSRRSEHGKMALLPAGEAPISAIFSPPIQGADTGFLVGQAFQHDLPAVRQESLTCPKNARLESLTYSKNVRLESPRLLEERQAA